MKICFHCDKEILEKEKQVQINTQEDGVIINEENFHWKCWIDYFNDCVRKKVEKIRDKSIKLAGQTIKRLGGFLKTENSLV